MRANILCNVLSVSLHDYTKGTHNQICKCGNGVQFWDTLDLGSFEPAAI